VFDFDGTLSLVRGHWQGLMVPMMVQTLAAADPHASPDELTEVVEQFVTALTGKPTMHQILALVEEVRQRGGQPPDPQQYLADYLAQLAQRTQRRLAALACGQMRPDDLLVPGARPLLQALADRGWLLAVASGTEQGDVRREAAALGIDHFFGPRIWGPVQDDPAFSKQEAIQRLMHEHGLGPDDVAVVGDGPAEILAGRALGLLTVGVASDEQRPCGGIHPRKREHLLAAGADVIVPDFREHEAVVALLEGNLAAAGALSPDAGACG
jgi:phosphoglycolate phosphatase-like HAD superfamily hydrolase